MGGNIFGQGDITEMAVMSIYGKTLFRTTVPIALKLDATGTIVLQSLYK